MNPIDSPELFDSIVVAGVTSPGIVTLTNHDRKQKWDVKDADGSGGASTTWKGEQVAQFTATFDLIKGDVGGTMVDELADWEEFAAVIRSSLQGKTPKALDIYHPDLAANDIKSVSQATIGGMKHDGKGGATVAVDFLEYRPAKKKGGTPNGSKANAKTSAPDPNADLKAQIDGLLQQARQP